ncbi:5'-nucleotidase C-terminal domain-containing protein [Demequina sp.]|uniref:5'-nucleotidase C-terminal domain-containing protein n=1 Tax=Demequina sp. TaxID=2050685 RepID=UPI003D13F3E6
MVSKRLALPAFVAAAAVVASGLTGVALVPPADAAVDSSSTPALVKITEFTYKYTAGTENEFVELTNVGAGTLNLTGWVLTDNHRALTGDSSVSLSAVTSIAAGESIVVSSQAPADFRTLWGLPESVQVVQEQNGIGFGSADSIALYDAQGNLADLVDYTGVSANKSYYAPKAWLGANSFSHWVQYQASDVPASATSPAGFAAVIGTPGTTATNQYSYSLAGTGASTCQPEAASGTGTATTPGTSAWPGSATVTPADAACSWLATNGPEGRDISALVFDNQTADGSVLYSVKNKSKLFRMTKTDGIWHSDGESADNWADGKEIRFGAGVTSNSVTVTQPDTEGLTQGPDGTLYVTTERANDANKYSLNSVLAFDPTDDSSTLTPTRMWDLRADFASLFTASAEGTGGNKDDANLGFEGITYVPDTYLLANSFYDQKKAKRYNPADYPLHGEGLFFLGLEKNGHIYAYALNSDGTFSRVADIAGNTPNVHDLQFDPVKRGIWALCDNTCNVTQTFYTVNGSTTAGLTAAAAYNRPAGLPNVNIEGFAISAVAGSGATREVVWADDGIFPFGHALYSGSIDNTIDLNLVNLNDFHGRIDSNTVGWAGYVQTLASNAPEGRSLILSAGDNISASLYASASQHDNPSIDVLNQVGVDASSLGNHELDQGLGDLQAIVNGTGVHAGHAAEFPFLGANVVLAGTTEQPEGVEASERFVIDGVKISVIGAVTQETPALVSPAGVADLEFLTPWEGINAEVARLKADDPADVYIAVIHEGPIDGSATLESQTTASPVFGHIVNDIDPAVSALILGHTHQVNAWDALNPGAPAGQATTRPVIQTGSYGANIGNIVLSVDPTTKKVVSYTQKNVNLLNSTPAKTYTVPDSYFTSRYPAVAQVKSTVDAALAAAAVSGNVISGKITQTISRGGVSGGTYTGPGDTYTGGAGDDRSTESATGTLIADALRDKVTDYLRESDATAKADIGIVNPGGIRAALAFAKDTNNANETADGMVSVAELNAVLPFVNNLYTSTVTGEVLKKILEQQWQRTTDDQSQWSNSATIPSRSYLQLGLSDNASYTFDPSRPEGDRITGIWIDGDLVTDDQTITVATFSFLAAGGDNFRAFKQGTSADTGLVDYQAWIQYFEDHSGDNGGAGVAPDFSRRSVGITGLDSTYGSGDAVNFTLGAPISATAGEGKGTLDMHATGAPKATTVSVSFVPESGPAVGLGTAAVDANGTAAVSFTAPTLATAATGVLELTVAPTNTVVRVPVTFGPGELTTAVPAIAGTAKVGSTLTASSDDWGPAPVDVVYEWYAGGTKVGTGPTLELTAALVGEEVIVKATGTKTGFATASTTSAAITVQGGTITTATPTIAGTAKVGSTLTAKAGMWQPSGVRFAYQWFANGVAIAGATGSTFVPTSAQYGKQVTVEVTGFKAGYVALAKTSSSVKIAAGTITPATPRISGTARVGSTLKVSVGSWKPSGITYKYQWYVSGKPVPGATKSTYKITSGARGKTITVKVTGSKAGYTTVAKSSAATSKVR